MRVEVLYFDGCPTHLEAEETLRGVLARVYSEAEVELVAVDTDEGTRRLRPTAQMLEEALMTNLLLSIRLPSTRANKRLMIR